MNSPSDDDMFSRYRTELVMDADARARTFRKLQERVLRGEHPAPEIDALPPPMAAVRSLWGLPAKWVVLIAGLGLGALIVANVVLGGAPPTAHTGERVMVVQPLAVEDDRASAVAQGALLADAETGAAARAQNAGAQRARAGRNTSARSNTELAKRSSNAAQAPVPQPTARVREAGAPRSDASRAHESVSPAEPSAVEPRLTAAVGAQAEGAPLAVADARPSAAAANAKQHKQPYASPKEKDAVPQRSDKEIASETLTKEVQLLQAAQLALRAGDTQRSLALLAEHTWTYPQGHLAEARDVARILALCQAGNIAQSKLHAKRFLQQRPESPYALRVRAGCEAMTNPSASRRDPTP